MMIVTDTHDYTDYPVYVMPSETISTRLRMIQKSEDRVEEVYSLARNLEEQLNEARAFHLD